jgi:hypothetical protein
MQQLKLVSDDKVSLVFENYPEHVKSSMYQLRSLVIETAGEMEEITSLEETLKWGDPSYVAKHGSTLRMDWKAKNPNQFALYFKCTSKLVETFRLVFKDLFEYENNRAILFRIDEKIPVPEVKECIKATLRYHKVKQDTFLGIQVPK